MSIASVIYLVRAEDRSGKMAKTPKVKARRVSLHSRAARREAPVAPAKGAPEKKENQHWLYSSTNAGVSKKTKKKQLTRQQKERQRKALELADRNLDRLEKKTEESKKRGKKVKQRAKDWDELNGKAVEAEKAAKKEGGEPEATSGAVMEDVEATMPVVDESVEVQAPKTIDEQPLPIRTIDGMDSGDVSNHQAQSEPTEVVDDIT